MVMHSLLCIVTVVRDLNKICIVDGGAKLVRKTLSTGFTLHFITGQCVSSRGQFT